MAKAELPNEIHYECIKEGFDPFGGSVCIFEDLEKITSKIITPAVLDDQGNETAPAVTKDTKDAKRFWVEHQRKDIYSDFVTADEAENLYNKHISDTQFA